MTTLANRFSILLLAAAAPLFVRAADPSAAAETTVTAPKRTVHEDASAAIPKRDPTGKFMKMHESFLARAKAGPIGLLFLGDSITDNWRSRGKAVWDKTYAGDDAANFGIGGDRTQHVIWRIENGELDGIHPRVVVLMIGTNNSGDYTGAQIAAADARIVQLIRQKIPTTKVLLLAIFPRGPHKGADGKIDDGVARMQVIRDANAQLAKLDDGKNIRFLDIGEKFLGPDGKIPKDIMPDQLHPSEAGYRIWVDAMAPLLREMMRQN